MSLPFVTADYDYDGKNLIYHGIVATIDNIEYKRVCTSNSPHAFAKDYEALMHQLQEAFPELPIPHSSSVDHIFDDVREYYGRQLELAIEIAVKAHVGQVDKGGFPYITHPLAVSARVKSYRAKIVAVLHDVVEDTSWTFEALREAGIDEDVLDILDEVTHRKGETYDQYLIRLAKKPIAVEVKLADLEENLDLTRIAEPTAKDFERLRKYRRAKEILLTKGIRYFHGGDGWGVKLGKLRYMASQEQASMLTAYRTVFDKIEQAEKALENLKHNPHKPDTWNRYENQLADAIEELNCLNKTYQGRLQAHFKQNFYTFDKVTRNSETLAWEVCYTNMKGLTWIRPFEMMFDTDERYAPQETRFVFVER